MRKKLILSPCGTLPRKRDFYLHIPVVLSFSCCKTAALPELPELYQMISNVLGKPDHILTMENRGFVIWIVPVYMWENIREFFSQKEIARIEEILAKKPIGFWAGIAELREFLKKKYIIVDGCKLIKSKKSIRRIRENAEGFYSLIEELKKSCSVKWWKVEEDRLVISVNNGDEIVLQDTYKTPKGFRIRGKYFRNPQEALEYLLQLICPKTEEEVKNE